LDGNLGAQETLYNRYRKIVKDFIRSKYSIYYDIDDDVSEIMIKVFLGLETYDKSKSKFNTWVLNITKNYMIDKWRSNTVTLTSLNNASLTASSNCQYFVSTNTDSVEWSANGAVITANSGAQAFTVNGSYTSCNADFENCSSVNYITTQLSPSDYTLLDMKYVQGYDYCEIGKEFNLTSTTISNKVNYIKTKLKKNIEVIYE